jgi:3-deoxy-D-manno-octulosonate 8-phosphate phosphatase (KDO 8-P phosphatase)
LKKIKAVALDVDGVLTDGSFIWGKGDEEYKKFSFRDIMGISLAQKSGLIFALISGENSPQIDRLASKLQISDIFKGCKDKASALKDFANKHDLNLSSICFMGDDVNDVSALELAGLSAAPSTAHEHAKEKAGKITINPGGQGAVRELLDFILLHNNGVKE